MFAFFHSVFYVIFTFDINTCFLTQTSLSLRSLADCCPLLDVPDMIMMGNHPDAMCVFTYVQSLCHHLSKIEKKRKDEQEEKAKAEAEEKVDGVKNEGEEKRDGEGQEEQEKADGLEEKDGIVKIESEA